MEILEILDWKTGKKTGGTADRRIVHLNGLPHKAVHLWIFTQIEKEIYLLLQQRSEKKINFPGYFAATVGGHVKQNETLESISREAEEEIGAKISIQDMKFLYSHPYKYINDQYIDFEWIDEYLLLKTISLDQLIFNDGEVTGIFALTQQNLRKAISNRSESKIRGFFFDGSSIKAKTINSYKIVDGFFDSKLAYELSKPDLVSQLIIK